MCEAALPQRLLHDPCLVSTEKSAKGPMVGQEGNESAQEAHSPAFVPFLLWGHLAGAGGGAVGRCCVSEGTPAGTVPVTFQGDI